MSETLRLSYFSGNQERRVELIREPCKLDEETWDWLKSAFIAIGFSVANVTEFFAEPGGEAP